MKIPHNHQFFTFRDTQKEIREQAEAPITLNELLLRSLKWKKSNSLTGGTSFRVMNISSPA